MFLFPLKFLYPIPGTIESTTGVHLDSPNVLTGPVMRYNVDDDYSNKGDKKDTCIPHLLTMYMYMYMQW